MQISLRDIAALILTLVFVVTAAISVMQGAAHSLNLPMCWSCGASKVRRSANSRVTDALAKFLFLVPYRCRSCRRRFYGLRSNRLLHRPPT
jgi:hypothetical protein